ncbi:autotransporter assembly complex protein TamA [Plasticicumulans sp.]|uniref:autotransporter assembly complex protein TamA n=1 Tax=Plasticicumulans sp. TaxID=2307179 RepID=UPI0039402ACA
MHHTTPGWRRVAIALLLTGSAATAHGQASTPGKTGVPVEVVIEGIEDERLRVNVANFLSIRELASKPEATDSRIAWEHRKAEEEIRTALQPFGYYRPTIQASLERDGPGWRATYRVTPGTPVRVRTLDIQLSGAATGDASFHKLLKNLPIHVGEAFEHEHWEKLKSGITGLITEHGYFSAQIVMSEVRVDPAAGSADVHLHVDSGRRYRFGETTFHQTILKDEVLRRYNRIKPGDPYDAAALIDLQGALADADYYQSVEIEAGPDRAEGDTIPLDVRLRPRLRERWDFGLGYGTDTGPRGRIGFKERWVNDLGHKFTSDLRVSQIKTTLAAEYLIPGNDPRLEQYSIHSRADYEDSTTVENRLFLIGVGQKLQAGDWQRLTALDWQIERFRYFDTPADIMLLIPSVTFSRSTVDDSLRVYRGERLSLQLRGALEPILSDNTFFQVTAGVKEVWPLGKDMRLLARFDAGTTWTSDPEQLPSSVRYYAGGDTSIRGYEYQSIGPRNDRDKVIGGRHMLVGSIELEHRVVGDWSVAAFVDAGDAFERSPSMKLGAGIGVRWTSPIGPIRLDLAHGFDEPGDSFRIHFTLGPDL